jgi:uncharacterized protein involved in exopolysaccharide biosynthesis
VRDQDEIDLADLWRAAWRYKYLFVSTTIVSTLIALYLALTATPIFRAEVVVAEVGDSPIGTLGSLASQLGGLADLAGVNLGGAEPPSKHARAVLESRQLAEEFVKRGNLLATLFPEGDTPTLWVAVRGFREGVLSIARDDLSGLTTVTVEWEDPDLAAKWANDFVALANDVIRSRAIDDSTRNIAYLNEQLARTNVVDIQRVMYNLIENETKTLMLANGQPEYAFKVIDPAVPPEIRISPRRTNMVLIGMLIGVVLGVAAAFVHGRVYPSLRGAWRSG